MHQSCSFGILEFARCAYQSHDGTLQTLVSSLQDPQGAVFLLHKCSWLSLLCNKDIHTPCNQCHSSQIRSCMNLCHRLCRQNNLLGHNSYPGRDLTFGVFPLSMCLPFPLLLLQTCCHLSASATDVIVHHSESLV